MQTGSAGSIEADRICFGNLTGSCTMLGGSRSRLDPQSDNNLSCLSQEFAKSNFVVDIVVRGCLPHRTVRSQISEIKPIKMTIIKVAFAGKNFNLSARNGADYVARQIANGSYEPPLPMLMMAALVRVEGCFVDVGANTGVYTVMAAAIAPDRRIVAFEPLPAALEVLKENVELNDLDDTVELHEVALSHQSGTAVFYLPDPGHGLVETSATLESGFQPSHSTVRVQVMKFDDISIPDTIGIIKVDIEGHEHAFLRGARETIMRDRPMIFAEVVGPSKRAAIGAFLHNVDYMDFRLRPDMAIHDGEVEFDNAAWNHAFVPRERLSSFQAICHSCHLPMLRKFALT